MSDSSVGSRFTALWLATVIANAGNWIRDMAAAWLMAGLAVSAASVALVQTVTLAPMVLLALPAGAVADLVDRRYLLMATYAAMLGVGLSLAGLTYADRMTPELLLLFCVLAGTGTAITGPAWQALIPDLVRPSALKNAMALNSVGINVARAVGPAIGGALLVAGGVPAAFAVAAMSCLAPLAVLSNVRQSKPVTQIPRESLMSAIRGGVRFVAASWKFQRVLLRAASFFLIGSALWALLPIVVRVGLRGDADTYGLLLAAVGIGALLCAPLLGLLRRRLSAGRVVFAGGVIVPLVIGALALSPATWVAFGFLLFAGGAWIAVVSTLFTVVQSVLPAWVRARGIAVFFMTFYGSMALGSYGWGVLASVTSIGTTLLTVATLGVALAAVAARIELPADDADLTPARAWADPEAAQGIDNSAGPVMVTVEYNVAEADRSRFRTAIRILSGIRQRNGATLWHAFEDVTRPGRFTEMYLEENWAAHLRHHARMSKADAAAQATVVALSSSAVVRHFVSADAISPAA